MEPIPLLSEYLVPAEAVEHEIEIKRSRFLCLVHRIEDEEAARRIIGERRRMFHDARHTCSAFLVGPGREVARSSDDGEPAGTAGAPMLDALMRFDMGAAVSDTVAVVTRWFGGTLLGAGGLTRAYSRSVAETLTRTGFTARRLRRTYSLLLDHQVAGRSETLIRSAGMTVTDADHLAAGVRLTLAAPATISPDEVHRRVQAATSGRGTLTTGPVLWADVTARQT